MACPFFQPTGRAEETQWLTPPRLPLGAFCTGVCTSGNSPFEPDPETLRTWCNRGYARRGCPRFPGGESPDALRFSVADDRDDCLTVVWIYERNHAPARHGRATFRGGDVSTDLDDSAAHAQLRAFAENYLRRKVSV